MWSSFRLRKSVFVVLIDTYSTQNFYYTLIISQLCRILHLDYIPILHGGNLPSRLKSNPILSRLIFSNSKYNVSPSLYLKEAFEIAGFKNTVHIPNTIKIEDYAFKAKSFDQPKLFWVRSFSKIYNPKLAVKVLKSLKKSYPDAQLCMVGPDSDGTLDDVKALANTLELDVRLTGKLSKKEWREVSKDYNIFINTTNFDNTPVSVIEAMALGLPIVSTNVGGMPYLIAHKIDGLLVESNDVNQMTAAIVSLIKNPEERNILIKNARQKAESFDWKHIKSLWFDAFGINNDES
jgi:glycosyltransferase involved in cell wall biosynthesis